MTLTLKIFEELEYEIDFGGSLRPLVIVWKPALLIDLLYDLFKLKSFLEFLWLFIMVTLANQLIT